VKTRERQLEECLREIYLIMGRADPTSADYIGALKVSAHCIETKHPEIANAVCEQMHWNLPLFPDFYEAIKRIEEAVKA
jgi:hypothetical protein